ncbi:MAG: hypothetical protein HY983_02010, partial [Candidatus Magasanikbacteria bacterium]|nr:hypothetical protein [Candidatus Magasanikbacteria bacterium]
ANASSSVGAGLQVAGALSASGTLQVSSTSTLNGAILAASSGNVGIGTSAPSQALQVHTAVLGGGMYLSSNSPGIQFGNNVALGSATYYGVLGLATGAASWGSSAVAGDLVLSSGSVNLILATGATPSTAGTSRITINSTTGLVTLSNALSAGGNIYTSSRIGAGNTSPGVVLHVGTAASTQGYIRLENSGSTNKEANIYNDTTNGGLHIDTYSNLYPIQLDGSLVRMTPGFISNASSSVGAGLQVAGALNASGTLLTNNIIPASNNGKDVGAFGTAYRTLYASTSVLIGNPGGGGGTPIDVQSSFNGDTILNVTNKNSGSSAAARYQVQNDTSNGSLSMFGSGYSLAAGFANRFVFLTGTAAAGIDMLAQATTGNIRLMAGGLTTGLFMGSDRKVAIGSWSSGVTPVASDQLTVYGNIRAGNGTVSSTLGGDFLTVASSTANMNGLFYVDSSGNVSASGTLGVFGATTLGGNLTFSGTVARTITGPDVGGAGG